MTGDYEYFVKIILSCMYFGYIFNRTYCLYYTKIIASKEIPFTYITLSCFLCALEEISLQ